jgi:hypothetical protein
MEAYMNIILKVFRLSIKFVPVTGNDSPSYVPPERFFKIIDLEDVLCKKLE